VVEHSVITKEPIHTRSGDSLFLSAPVGHRSTSVYGPAAEWRLRGVPDVLWLAFCSGEFLKADGRPIPAPFSSEEDASGYHDKTEVYDDPLGAPKKIDIFTHGNDLICAYRVLQSTNVAGINIPLQFVIEEYRKNSKDETEIAVRATGVVVSLQKASRPEVPGEVMSFYGREGRTPE
jgi:hypothetical protein